MKSINFFLFFYISSIILFNLLFFSCFSRTEEYEKLQKEYSLYITSTNIPLSIKRDLPYRIGVRIYLFDQNLNWSICLASFRSLAFNLTGARCTNKIEEGIYTVYEIELPKDGFIYFKNPEYLISDYENVIVNFCYNYYSVIGLEGCFYKDRTCELRVSNTFPIDGVIRIERAESYYNEAEKKFYLRIYLTVEYEENKYVLSYQEIEKDCFIRENIDKFRSLYEIRYAGKIYKNETDLRINSLNQINIPFDDIVETPNLYVEIKFNYNIIRRIFLGRVRVEK
ncbi:MAG: hypothetical protein QW648_01750 [Nanoarchaeales archaeon]